MDDKRLYGTLEPGASRLKHKDRESLHQTKRQPPPPRAAVAASTTVKAWNGSKGTEITSSKKLLAGYMAHEFRTKWTVLGRKLEAETAEKGKLRAVAENEIERYKEITSLVMMKNEGGIHIPGIVNPTQLARWIQM